MIGFALFIGEKSRTEDAPAWAFEVIESVIEIQGDYASFLQQLNKMG
jgi:hypothetical protein